jgi:hypothetical protein
MRSSILMNRSSGAPSILAICASQILAQLTSPTRCCHWQLIKSAVADEGNARRRAPVAGDLTAECTHEAAPHRQPSGFTMRSSSGLLGARSETGRKAADCLVRRRDLL